MLIGFGADKPPHSLSLHLEFYTGPFKIQINPYNLLFPSYFVHVLFIIIFYFGIIYKIKNIFQFHSYNF